MGDEIVNGKEWARKFSAKFIQPGLVKFKIKGREIISLLRKETIENALSSLVGKGLRIGHANATSHGAVGEAVRDAESGWFECRGIAETKESHDAIKAGQRVSCAYRVNSTAAGGTLNNVPYDEEITGIEFTHLAIVGQDDARYEDAVIVLNSKSSDNPTKTIMNPLKWILKKLGTDGKPVEQTGEIPADDTRLNSLVEKYRAAKKGALPPAEAFVEIDGQQVAMSDLLALEVTNETDAAKLKREAAEAAAAKAKEDERLNARKAGYAAFMDVAKARQSAATQTVDDVEFISPDTMQHRVARSFEVFGPRRMSISTGKN